MITDQVLFDGARALGLPESRVLPARVLKESSLPSIDKRLAPEENDICLKQDDNVIIGPAFEE